MIFISLITLIFTNPSQIIEIMVNASGNSFVLCLELVGIYALWMGILEIMDKSGVQNKISRLFSPFVNLLFKTESVEAKKAITINLTANFLGLGNAATPSGIEAMHLMDRKDGKASKGMIMLLVLNATAIQLFPTTIIGIRAAAGSNNPSDIFFPTLLTAIFSTLIGVLICWAIEKIKSSLIKSKK